MSDPKIERIVTEYEPLIQTYFRRRVKNEVDVEDLAQESMCAIISGFARFRHESSLATWIYAICSNHYSSFRRGEVRASRLFLKLTSNEGRMVSDDGERVDRDLLIEIAYDRLPDWMRRLFTERYRNDRSVKEIAALLDIAEGTVKYRLFQIRNELKRILG